MEATPEQEDELEHIHTYKGKLCESRPGTPPMMFPIKGTNCPKCEKRDAAYNAQLKKGKKS